MTRTRQAWLAAGLALLYPGLGHVYLRAWFRALAWFGLALVTATLVAPADLLEAISAGDLDAVMQAARTLPIEATAALVFVRLLNVADAYLTAQGRVGAVETPKADMEGEQPAECPACGKELDDDLDFCPWCTHRLDNGEGEGDEEAGEEGQPTTAR